MTVEVRLVRPKEDESRENMELHQLFDGSWYLERYPDVAAAGLDPLVHYLEHGAFEGRNPLPLFDGRWYLDRYPEIADNGLNPLIHFIENGAVEGRDPHPLFDIAWYFERYPEIATTGLNPLAHFIERGAAAGGVPHPLFDANWYFQRYPDVAAAGINPFVHYIRHGAEEGRDPHPLFFTAWYLKRYPDVAASGVDPVIHYILYGASEGRDPHPLFDTAWYLQHYPDVATLGVNPLVHYIERGAAAGHHPSPLFPDHNISKIERRVAVSMRARWDRRLKVTGPMAMVVSGFGRYCYRRSRFSSASLAYEAALRLSPYRRRELLGPLIKCAVRQDRFDQAFALLQRGFAAASSPGTSSPRAVVPPVAHPIERSQKICVFTSVMPRRIEAQQAALRSWRAAGLSVISVNSMSEVMELRPYFPDIRFHTLDKPIVDGRGRPLVPIEALIQAAKDVPEQVCGIINSDIEFRGRPDFFDLICKEISGSLVFGNRTDLSDIASTRGKIYRNGYDFFFWEKENSTLFEGAPMILGLPWWDFWLPLHAFGQGLKTKRFVTSSMGHITHTVGYDNQAYLQFGRQFAKTLLDVYGQWTAEAVPTVRVFLHRLFAPVASIPFDHQNDAITHQIDMLCDVSNCLIDALSQTVTLPDARLGRGARAVV